MGIPRWGLILGSVALLLDPTFADVLVQQGYDQQSNQETAERTPTTTYVQNSQRIVQPNQNYVSQQNPVKQILEYQHKIQQNQLQSIHQQERDQLLQMQHQQLQHPMVQQSQVPGNDIVSTPLAYRPYHHHSLLPAMGGFKGGRLFSLGPLGLNTFSVGGLGGLTPLLLSPHQPQQITGSNQFEKSSTDKSKDGNREKRQVRDGGEPNGRKWRQKINSRTEQSGMAENQALTSKKSNPNSQIVVQPRKSNGTAKKSDEDTVGSRSLLDPLGLADKAEDLIEDLKHGHLPNPLDIFNGGGPASHPSWLNKESPGSQKFEEHVVSQPNQYQQPNYGMQSSQGQQSIEPITGGAWKYPNDSPPLQMPTNSWLLGQSNSFPAQRSLMYRMPEQTIGHSWNGRSNNMMANEGYRETPWAQVPQNSNSYSQPSLAQQQKSQTRGWTNGEVDQFTGAANPKTGPDNKSIRDQLAAENPIRGKDSITGTSNADTLTPNLQSTGNSLSADPSYYRQIYGGLNPVRKTGQPVMGTLYDPITGNARPAAAWNGYQTLRAPNPVGSGSGRMGRSDVVGNSLTEVLYGIGNQLMGYGNGNYPYNDYGYGMENIPGRHFRPNFDLDDIFDNGYGYNNFHNYGNGYDRPYGNGYGYDDGFYGNNGGLYPQNHHHHHHTPRPQFF